MAGGCGDFVEQNRMEGTSGPSLPSGIQEAEIPVGDPAKLRPRRRLVTLSGNDALTNGIEYKFSRIMQIQFLQDVAAMSLDRVRADVEGAGDFLVGLAFG